MRHLTIAFALVSLASCHNPTDRRKIAANGPATGAEAGAVKGVDRSHKGALAPATPFDDEGREASLADFKGKPTLVNLWASWCAPCVKELPTLDKLSRANPAIQVVAVSQDSGPRASVVAFLQTHRIASLAPYQDSKMGLSGALNAAVLPTSVLYDSNGREVWRFVGDLDWTGAEAARLLSEAGSDKQG